MGVRSYSALKQLVRHHLDRETREKHLDKAFSVAERKQGDCRQWLKKGNCHDISSCPYNHPESKRGSQKKQGRGKGRGGKGKGKGKNGSRSSSRAGSRGGSRSSSRGSWRSGGSRGSRGTSRKPSRSASRNGRQDVCRDYLQGKCTRQNCKFKHPPTCRDWK